MKLGAPTRTRAADVARSLARAVEQGQFKPGDRLPAEGTLADQFEVSRPVIREALSQLVGRRLIRVENGRPPTVLPPTPDPLADYFRHAATNRAEAALQLLELRRGLEHQCGLMASKRRDRADCDELLELIKQLRSARDSGDRRAYARHDIELHMAIAKMSRNAYLADLLHALRDTVFETSVAAGLEAQHDNLERVHQVHEDIVSGIVDGDWAKTSDAIRRHFEMALTSIDPSYW